MQKIAIIGYGNMGAAFATAVRSTFPHLPMVVCEKNEERKKTAEHELGEGVFFADTAQQLSQASVDLVLIAVKPNQLSAISDLLHACKDSLFLSIMAGVTLETLQKSIDSSRVVRMMPNLAAAFQQSATAICPADGLSEEDLQIAQSIAAAAGKTIVISEANMASIIGLAGSGIAFAFQFLHAMALGGTKTGLAYQESLEVVLQTMKGAATAIENSKIHPAEYVSKVCSPGGTTIEGISALENGGFTDTIIKAVHAAAEKSRLMEKG